MGEKIQGIEQIKGSELKVNWWNIIKWIELPDYFLIYNYNKNRAYIFTP